MLSPWRDILLQLLLSGGLTFVIPLLCYAPGVRCTKRVSGSEPNINKLAVWSCAVSIVLCFACSSLYHGMVPINMALLPLFIGILYGGFRPGIALIILYVGCHEVMYGFSWTGALLHTALPIYPLMFWISLRFAKSTLIEKIGWLWSGLIPALLIIAALPLLDRNIEPFRHSSEVILITFFYILISIFNGGLIVYLLEYAAGIIRKMTRPFIEEASSFRGIMDGLPFGVAAADHTGSIVVGNKLFHDLHQIGSDTRSRAEGYLKHALRGGWVKDEIVRGNSKIYSATAFPLQDGADGNRKGAVVLFQDITDTEKMKTELLYVERLNMVGQMAASITHEIRNPMAVIRGFLQLMKEKSPPELDHYYKIVMDELDRANGIINDFLSLAQNRVSEKESCHLHDIIQELSPLLWADANLRGQRVELVLGSEVPSMFLNRKEMKQLILNLCRNAMEAMDAKGILTIRTCSTELGVELRIKDTGNGISEEQMSRLFEPFFTTKTKGTGLGLSLCQSIVQRHNAAISVQSVLGAGTEFKVLFSSDNKAF